MMCPRCRHDNPAEQKFCGECGARLASTCAGCGAQNPPGQKFCGECGTSLTRSPTAPRFASPDVYTPRHLADKILTSRSALEGERKQVTVLFCDLANSTALADRVGPEAMHGILNRFFEVAMAEVHRYEGTVNQFLGDGFMALFGAPIAHEDHPRRAALAALGVRRRLDETRGDALYGVVLNARMGLNTGLVIVGAIGDNLRMDYTAIGDTTNVAARLQQAAVPGQIVVAEATHRLIAGYCITEALSPLSLKGKPEPVLAWELKAVQESRTRLEVEAERGLTPFVGRRRELELLAEGFAEAREGRGRLVFLTGDAGLGKSRLLHEFRQRLGAEVNWLEGHALSFGRSMAFHPVVDLLKRAFLVQDGDPESVIVEKIERAVLGVGRDLAPTLPYVRNLLVGDPGEAAVRAMDPQLRRAETFEALRHLLLAAASVRPQVVVLEDLHWVDPATEAFLAFVGDSVPASRILWLVTHRPGYVHPFGDRTYHTRISLTALTTADRIEMARGALATERLPEVLQKLIIEKAEGNPFFIEETVKSLREAGAIVRKGDGYVLARPIEDIVAPDTIHDVLMARIDRLEEGPKRTLQIAAVIGREFPRGLLERLSESREQLQAHLQPLKALELVYEKGVFPEIAYTFKHALMQDVAYHSLLTHQRQALHRLVAQAMEQADAERGAERYEVLGYHFARGAEWTKAVEYLIKAAEKATRAFATAEAISLYDQSLEAAGHLPDVDVRAMMRMRQAKASLLFAVGDFVASRAEAERLLTLARTVGDRGTEGVALASMAWAATYSHDFGQALADAEQARTIAAPVNVPAVIANSHATTGFVHLVTGQLERGRGHLEDALSLGRSINDLTTTSVALYALGMLKNWQADYDDAIQVQSEGIQIARTHHLLSPLIRNLFAHGFTLIAISDYDGARAVLEEGLALAEKVGNALYHYRILNCLGRLYLDVGDLARAFDFNRESAEGARKRSDPEVLANAELNLADVCLAQGDLALAAELLDSVHGLVRHPGTSEWMRWRYSMHLFASLAELWLARGDPAKARQFTASCLEIATRTHSRKYLTRGHRLDAESALLRGELHEAEQALALALDVARAVRNPTELWKTYHALGRLHADGRRPEQARQAHAATREIVERLTIGIRDGNLRDSFRRFPPVRAVYGASGPD